MKYRLISKKGTVLPITIDESAKEDFKELMEWDELTFRTNTCIEFQKLRKEKKMEIKEIDNIIDEIRDSLTCGDDIDFMAGKYRIQGMMFFIQQLKLRLNKEFQSVAKGEVVGIVDNLNNERVATLMKDGNVEVAESEPK